MAQAMFEGGQAFLFDLQQEMAFLISDIHLFWEQEDEQRVGEGFASAKK